MTAWLRSHPRARRYLFIVGFYALSTVITIGGGYLLGMQPSYDKQCWGWTSE